MWPDGVSNPAQGNVSPLSITTSLAIGESHRETVSLTLPGTGALTNMVDVFLLFDDTGSFVSNSPIVRSAFPTIMSQLEASLSGVDLAFGVGRFEEYANFASEYAAGRPFILNQPIVAATTPGYTAAIQAALNRTTPGYGGDQPETDIEALYQLVTGAGFDGNNNGSVMDSGAAGLGSTQLTPGNSGDVPSFASFMADASASVLPAAGNVGGGGFRAGALPVILLATDTGFAYQPMGETSVTGIGGISVPVSSLTQTSRPSTPFSSGAGLQETVTGLNALGALVIGLGTNTQANIDPRQGLEALSRLTGATNQTTTTIANGTADPIAPGDPLYFQIATGFAGSVADGVMNAIQNAVTNVAVNMTVQASDPRVHIINHTGVLNGLTAGQTGSFDIEFIGDGIPHRFDLQFVREGTNVVLGSIPVVIGTPVPGDGYEFDDLEEGEIELEDKFGVSLSVPAAPEVRISAVSVAENKPPGTLAGFLSTTPGAGNTYRYRLVSGEGSTDNSLFVIQGRALKTAATFDFETKNSYSVRVRSIDQTGKTLDQVFTISVLDQPEGTNGNDVFTLAYSGNSPDGTVTITVSTDGSAASSLGTFPMKTPLTLHGLDGTDAVTIRGTSGNDLITASGAGFRVNGATIVLKSTERLVLAGGPGNDMYRLDADRPLGIISLDESAGGIDTINFSATTSTDISIRLNSAGNQTVNSNLTLNLGSSGTFENAIGGSRNDILIGNGLANVLKGNAGSDRLNGGPGNDSLFGGKGDDTYLFSPINADIEADRVTEKWNQGTDTLNFSGQSIDVTLSLRTAAIQNVHTDRTLKLNSALNFENAIGGSGNDTLQGNTAGNVLVGNSGDDRVSGGSGRDLLIGGRGRDTLQGGADDDVLVAGRTTSDHQTDHLNDLRTGWLAGIPYATRVDNLRTGVGTTNTSLKARVNVLSDGNASDTLSGGSGDDWFLGALDDVITGLISGELLDVL